MCIRDRAGAAGPGARPLRLELARVKEELVDCARRLKELMPSHKVRCRTTWAGVDGWQWDRFQYQTWAELEGAGEQDGPTELDRMRLAVRLARERAVTDKQGEYLAQVEGGKKAAQVAREAGRHRGTVSRTVGRGRTKIAKEAKALYEVLQAQQGPGPLVVDLADGRVLEAVLSLLTPRQQLYLYLYYGEWLSLREIGRLLRVDHASVLRSIRCGLEPVSYTHLDVYKRQRLICKSLFITWSILSLEMPTPSSSTRRIRVSPSSQPRRRMWILCRPTPWKMEFSTTG